MTTSYDVGGDVRSDVGGDVGLHARALADPTRRRIFRTIVETDTRLDVPTLTALIDIHHTTVRSHLVVLRDAGLITEESEERQRPGRPRLQYSLAPDIDGAWETPDAYRRLAALLARAVRTGSTAFQTGRECAALERSRLPDDPLEALIEAIAAEGFDPVVKRTSDRSARVVLRRCPFADVATLDPATICGLHRGLVEGMAEQIGDLGIDRLHADPRVAGCHLEVSIEGSAP